MKFRFSKPDDIPAIVDLLRNSLGEGLIPKSESLWTWKHVANPFGPSPVLIAESDHQIIGVRAFMRWKFVENGKEIHAVRAVDTAVSPLHQGKGLFKSLTLNLLDELKSEGLDLVFNSPNKQSTPGYLKMGWEKYGKLPIHFKLQFPSSHPVAERSDWEAIQSQLNFLESTAPQEGRATLWQPGYFNWRYRDCPIFKYHFVTDFKDQLLIYRIKSHAWGKEFRICDWIDSTISSPEQKVDFLNRVKEEIQNSGAALTTLSGLSTTNSKGLGFLPSLKLGPLLTLKKVNESFTGLHENWKWSLGDLELF